MEKNKIVAMLKKIYSIASDASMTGMLEKSAGVLIKHYNELLKVATEKGFVDVPGFFSYLPESANMDEIGVAAALLASYLADEHAPSLHDLF